MIVYLIYFPYFFIDENSNNACFSIQFINNILNFFIINISWAFAVKIKPQKIRSQICRILRIFIVRYPADFYFCHWIKFDISFPVLPEFMKAEPTSIAFTLFLILLT